MLCVLIEYILCIEANGFHWLDIQEQNMLIKQHYGNWYERLHSKVIIKMAL